MDGGMKAQDFEGVDYSAAARAKEGPIIDKLMLLEEDCSKQRVRGGGGGGGLGHGQPRPTATDHQHQHHVARCHHQCHRRRQPQPPFSLPVCPPPQPNPRTHPQVPAMVRQWWASSSAQTAKLLLRFVELEVSDLLVKREVDLVTKAQVCVR